MDRPSLLDSLRELSQLIGKPSLAIKKCWDQGTPILSVRLGLADELAASARKFQSLVSWADQKGIGLTFCDTQFDPEGSTECMKHVENRSYVFNIMEGNLSRMGEDDSFQKSIEEEAEEEGATKPT
jgi:hypothetical protein